MVFIEANENILEWILTVISNTVKYSSEMEGELFRFVPEYYIMDRYKIYNYLMSYKCYNLLHCMKWLSNF